MRTVYRLHDPFPFNGSKEAEEEEEFNEIGDMLSIVVFSSVHFADVPRKQ